MQASPLQRPAVLMSGLVAAAVLTGLVVSFFDPQWAVAGIAGALAIALVIYDYRVGVVCLTLLLPWFSSPLIPQTKGFNLINFLILASVGSLALRRSFGRMTLTPLPKVVKWCYLLPIGIATFVALPHLPIAAANYPALAPDYYQAFATVEFLKARVIKPMFFVVYSFLLANAVRDSAKPERFLLVFGISSVFPALSIVLTVLVQGAGVEQRGSYLDSLGFHPNSLGMQLALAAGPLLLLAAEAPSRLAKLGSAAAFLIVSIGLLLTGSRGAALAYMVVLLVWLIRRRRTTDLLFAAVTAVVFALTVPQNVWERLTLGLDDTDATTVSNMDDPLTKGRVASWALLAPDILLSPIWGQGIGSVAWNKAASAGQYGATLSHNMYLDILLDVGIVGFLLLMYLYYRYASEFRRLSKDEALSPTLRPYYFGALASFLGMLAMSVTNGAYMPRAENAFLWFSLGMAFAYWPERQPKRAAAVKRQVSKGHQSQTGGLGGQSQRTRY